MKIIIDTFTFTNTLQITMKIKGVTREKFRAVFDFGFFEFYNRNGFFGGLIRNKFLFPQHL